MLPIQIVCIDNKLVMVVCLAQLYKFQVCNCNLLIPLNTIKNLFVTKLQQTDKKIRGTYQNAYSLDKNTI